MLPLPADGKVGLLPPDTDSLAIDICMHAEPAGRHHDGANEQ
jgi:hypothetical protein